MRRRQCMSARLSTCKCYVQVCVYVSFNVWMYAIHVRMDSCECVQQTYCAAAAAAIVSVHNVQCLSLVWMSKLPSNQRFCLYIVFSVFPLMPFVQKQNEQKIAGHTLKWKQKSLFIYAHLDGSCVLSSRFLCLSPSLHLSLSLSRSFIHSFTHPSTLARALYNIRTERYTHSKILLREKFGRNDLKLMSLRSQWPWGSELSFYYPVAFSSHSLTICTKQTATIEIEM